MHSHKDSAPLASVMCVYVKERVPYVCCVCFTDIDKAKVRILLSPARVFWRKMKNNFKTLVFMRVSEDGENCTFCRIGPWDKPPYARVWSIWQPVFHGGLSCLFYRVERWVLLYFPDKMSWQTDRMAEEHDKVTVFPDIMFSPWQPLTVYTA